MNQQPNNTDSTFAICLLMRYYGLNISEISQLTIYQFKTMLKNLKKMLELEHGTVEDVQEEIDVDKMSGEQFAMINQAMGIKTVKVDE